MNTISIFQATIAVLLIVAILLQNRGTGLGAAFGGDFGSSYHTKRGIEKFLMHATIVLGALFILVGIMNVALF